MLTGDAVRNGLDSARVLVTGADGFIGSHLARIIRLG
jgi:nucleoside-diphosphate-sugar epimerase